MSQQVKTVLRRIYSGQTNEAMGLYNANDVDAYISGVYLAKGWTLFNTHYMGSSDGGHLVMWILSKE